MTLKLITLKTAHTLLGEATNNGLEGKSLKNPVQVVTIPARSQTEGSSIAFVPFLEFSEEFKTGVLFDYKDILCVTTPVRELENQYNQIFGAGIEITNIMPR